MTFAIVFGLVIGSFLNVVVHRLPIMLERAWRAEVSEAADEPLEEDGLPARYNLCGAAQRVSALRPCAERMGEHPGAELSAAARTLLGMQGACERCAIRCSRLASAAFAAGSLTLFGPTLTALAAFGLCAALLAMSAIDIDTHLLPDSHDAAAAVGGPHRQSPTACSRTCTTRCSARSSAIWCCGCVHWLFLAGTRRRRHGLRRLQAAGGARRVARLGGAAADRADRRRWPARSSACWRHGVAGCASKNRCRSDRFSRPAAR